MKIWSFYRNRVNGWIDRYRNVKAFTVGFLCILCEIISIIIAFVAQVGIGLRNLWIVPVGFPIALYVHAVLSFKGFDTKQWPDHAWWGITSWSYVAIIGGAVLGYLMFAEQYIFASLACYCTSIIAVCFLYLWMVLYYKQFSVGITLLQIARTFFAPLVAIPYMFLLVLGTDTRPNTKQTREEIKMELKKAIEEIRANEKKEEKEEREQTEFTAFASQLQEVYTSLDDRKYIITENGRRYLDPYNENKFYDEKGNAYDRDDNEYR